MNLNLVDSAVRFVKSYPLDGEFICWMVLSQPFIQLEPVFYDHKKILDIKYLSNVPTNDVHCPDPHKHLSSLWFVLIGWHNYLNIGFMGLNPRMFKWNSMIYLHLLFTGPGATARLQSVSCPAIKVLLEVRQCWCRTERRRRITCRR